MDSQRIDKWLWCSRLYKTRGIASDAVKSGRVSVNGQRVKASRAVRRDDVVVLDKPPYAYELTVLGFSNNRVPAAKTASLYSESELSQQRRQALAATLKASAPSGIRQIGRPSKRDRREYERLKRNIARELGDND